MASIACMFKEKVCQQIVPVYHHMWTHCRFNLMKGVCVRSRFTMLMKQPFTGKLYHGRLLLQPLSNQLLEEKNINKEYLFDLLCCNATGSHKLKPLLIGKYRNPRCLKHANRLTLPVIYRQQSNMWMTQEIFAEWFHDYFVPSVKDHLTKLNPPLKAHLLVDNCSAHPRNLTSDNGAIC